MPDKQTKQHYMALPARFKRWHNKRVLGFAWHQRMWRRLRGIPEPVGLVTVRMTADVGDFRVRMADLQRATRVLGGRCPDCGRDLQRCENNPNGRCA